MSLIFRREFEFEAFEQVAWIKKYNYIYKIILNRRTVVVYALFIYFIYSIQDQTETRLVKMVSRL